MAFPPTIVCVRRAVELHARTYRGLLLQLAFGQRVNLQRTRAARVRAQHHKTGTPWHPACLEYGIVERLGRVLRDLRLFRVHLSN
jgi:hypothetical protein